MSHYLDNQNQWTWEITEDSAKIVTDHGTHIHILDLTDATIGDMDDNFGETMGNAHRASPHYYK